MRDHSYSIQSGGAGALAGVECSMSPELHNCRPGPIAGAGSTISILARVLICIGPRAPPTRR